MCLKFGFPFVISIRVPRDGSLPTQQFLRRACGLQLVSRPFDKQVAEIAKRPPFAGCDFFELSATLNTNPQI